MPYLALQDLLNPLDNEPPPRNSFCEESPADPIPTIPPLTAGNVIPAHLIHTGHQIVHQDYRLNRKTFLKKVYQYPVSSYIEYPETGSQKEESIGHLFEMNPLEWHNPANDFIYSRGDPSGVSHSSTTVPLLVSSKTGEPVECRVRHSTCQGVKVCPYYDEDDKVVEHSSASLELLQQRISQERTTRLESSSPQRHIFEQTTAYLAAIFRTGCLSDASEVTVRNAYEVSSRQTLQERLKEIQRGRTRREGLCDGRLEFTTLFNGTPVVKCQHHSSKINRDHFFDATVGNSGLDLDYLEAVLCEDQEECDRLEEDAAHRGYGPKVDCQNVANFSSQRLYCAQSHRNSVGDLEQPLMERVECSVTFREYEPLEEFREECPYRLIVSRGPHLHPIPYPNKTPRIVQAQLHTLLVKIDSDLPDLTPRRFLRHPITKAFLRDVFPLLKAPMISDLHISLSNRSHLNVYINKVKDVCFPYGTGWKGLLYLKSQQDKLLDASERYIRVAKELPFNDQQAGGFEEDFLQEELAGCEKNVFRIVVCMLPDASRRLVTAPYLQSDIAFKRVVSYYEFELSALDRNSNTSVTFCRVYMTRRNGAAHHLALREIDTVLKQDTGRGLQWRHIHGTHPEDYGDGSFVLNWVVDQDRGQALGIGLWLQEVSREFPDKPDLHEPDRTLAQLTPYEHLRRFMTLCTVHMGRNIRAVSVSDEVRNLMRSLICVEHANWDETLGNIRTLGGKAGHDWLVDKETLPFVFPAISWERSYIPFDVWASRPLSTNTAEAAHQDVNREGIHSDLVEGKCLEVHRISLIFFLQTFEDKGVRETYATKHVFENAIKNVKRKHNARSKTLRSADDKIRIHNDRVTKVWGRLQAARGKVARAQADLEEREDQLGSPQHAVACAQLDKVLEAEAKLQKACDRQVSTGRALLKTGTGKTNILLPAMDL